MDNFKFKKNFGQNFITDKNLINKIVSLADITKDDLVIEVGPGAGALTTSLVSLAKYSLIYEIDRDLESILNNKLVDYDNYSLIFRDFLDVNVDNEIKDYKFNKLIFVSNLPYYITTPILKKFIDDLVLPDTMVVMAQDEVADRFSAKVGTRDYGYITVLLNAYYDVKKAMVVNRRLFNPVPNVDSAVIVMHKKSDVVINDINKFNRLIKDSFQFKRKNLRNNLRNYDLDAINNILERHNLTLASRAEEVSVDIFIEIANKI